MGIICRKCGKENNFSGEPPSFCGYCAHRLSDPGPVGPTQAQTAAYTPTPGEPAPSATPHPASIGRYRVIRFLGAGGMGTVYEAEDTESGRRVAIKLMAERLIDSSTTLERFRQEGALASQIAHPRCVFVLATDEDQGRPYIVMELMPGYTLRDQVGGAGPLSVADAIARIFEMIDGLQEAHRLGVLHRDVKPSNCFLLEDGTVKIGDFGLARPLIRTSHFTQTGAYLGTVLYSSPEQLLNDPLDFRADIYSVAATLYYLLTGQAPHPYESITEAAARAASQPPPDVRRQRPDVPRPLAAVIAKGLARKRDQRWQTLEEFRSALMRQMPDQLSHAGLGLRFGALVIDFALLLLRFLLPLESIRAASSFGDEIVLATSLGVLFLYFTVAEALWGCTLGKRLLRLRVARTERLEPPGWRRATVRTLIFGIPWLLPQLCLLISRGEAWLLLGQATILAIGLAVLLRPMSRKNGYRGWHELLSGTRVYLLPWPERSRTYTPRAPAPALLPKPHEIPEQIGPHVVHGLFASSGHRQFLLGEDRILGRRVLIDIHPLTFAPATSVRRELTRSTRLRFLAGGQTTDLAWEAYVAPVGFPLSCASSSAEPLSWSGARPILDQLARELVAAQADGTMPELHGLDQVWIQEDGRVQLLDAPSRHSIVDASTPWDPITLLRQTAAMLLEGRPRTDLTPGRRIQAPLPGHAERMLSGLMGVDETRFTPDDLVAQLEATRAKPREVTASARIAHLWILGVLLGVGLLSMFTTNLPFQALDALSAAAELDRLKIDRSKALPHQHAGLDERIEQKREEFRAKRAQLGHLGKSLVPPESDSPLGDVSTLNMQRLAKRVWDAQEVGPRVQVMFVKAALSLPIVFWPAMWILWAFIYRGGYTYRLMGFRIVRRDGRRASRWRCAVRAALVWLPVVILLLLANALQSADVRPGIVELFWWLAVGVLGAFAYLALIFPARSFHDILVGTWIVPE